MVEIAWFADFNHVVFGMNACGRAFLAQVVIRTRATFVSETDHWTFATVTFDVDVTLFVRRALLTAWLIHHDEDFQSAAILADCDRGSQFLVRAERDALVLFVEVLQSETMELNVRLECCHFGTQFPIGIILCRDVDLEVQV